MGPAPAEPEEPAPAAPLLAVSIEEVEARMKAWAHRAPQVPTWASSAGAPPAAAKAKGKRAKKSRLAPAQAPAPAPPPATLRVSKQQRLAAEARAAGFGLSPEEFTTKLKDLRALMPGVSATRLLALEDGVLRDLMSDTAAVADRLMQASSSLAAGALLCEDGKMFFEDRPGMLCGSCWGGVIRPIPLMRLTGHTSAIQALAFSPDGRRVVSGSYQCIRVWDLQARTCVATLPAGHEGDVYCLAITPDGRYAVSGGADNTLRVWDLQELTWIASLEGHSSSVNCLAMTHDGRHVLSGSWDHTVRVWDLQELSCTATLMGHTRRVAALTISPDGCRAVSGSADGTLRVWDLQAGTCAATLPLQAGACSTMPPCSGSDVRALAITPDGRQLIAAEYGCPSCLRTWDLQPTAPAFMQTTHLRNQQVVAITPDARHAICGGRFDLEAWDVQQGERVWAMRVSPGHSAGVTALAIAADGRRVVSGGADFAVSVWALQA